MRIKLFPFNKVPKGSNIVIYGMGTIGENFVRQIKSLCYCNIVGCIDKNYENKRCSSDEYVVLAPNTIRHLNYDYVVIASGQYKFDIEKLLLNELSVSKEKIILLDENYYFQVNITPERDWVNYYIEAEKDAENQFETMIKPVFLKYSLLDSHLKVMDFACGWGRIAALLKDRYSKLVLCDISGDALNYCRKRFAGCTNIEYIKSLTDNVPLDSESLDFIYSWDAMVHFSYKFLDVYFGEFERILKKGGICFIHHSNLGGYPENSEQGVSDNFHENIHWRSKVSAEDIARIARNNRFKVIEQIPLDWEGVKSLDTITVFRKI